MGNFLLDSIMSFLFHYPHAVNPPSGPSDEVVAEHRKRWRDEVHKSGNIKQKQIAAAAGGSKSSKKLEESSSEAERVAEDAIRLLESSKSKQ